MAQHIVMIEDDTFITQMYSTKLEQQGFEIKVFTNGEEGLPYIQTNIEEIDLVLLDIILPGKSGIDVLGELKDDGVLTDVPVIMLSNLSSQKDINTSLDMGAKDYIVKSNYTPKEISSLINKYI